MRVAAKLFGNNLAAWTLLALALLLVACGGGPTMPDSTLDLDPFVEVAQESVCADIRNRLFLIDDQVVFWDVAGNCSDAAYGRVLFGSSPDQVLCVAHDSIAGPVKNCPEAQYQALFDTIIANLDQPDLGLGSEHTVQPIPF